MRVGFGMLDLADFRGFGLRFRDFHFFLFDGSVDECAIVFLFFFKQAFQSARVFFGKLHFSKQDFFHDNGVFAEPSRDCCVAFSRNSVRLVEKRSRTM